MAAIYQWIDQSWDEQFGSTGGHATVSDAIIVPAPWSIRRVIGSFSAAGWQGDVNHQGLIVYPAGAVTWYVTTIKDGVYGNQWSSFDYARPDVDRIALSTPDTYTTWTNWLTPEKRLDFDLNLSPAAPPADENQLLWSFDWQSNVGAGDPFWAIDPYWRIRLTLKVLTSQPTT
jgi:hypothetical protein